MQLESIITIRRLVAGTITTSIGVATSFASEAASQIASVEPSWLSAAIKFGTLGAAIITIIAGCVRIWIDIRKELRDSREDDSDNNFDDDFAP